MTNFSIEPTKHKYSWEDLNNEHHEYVADDYAIVCPDGRRIDIFATLEVEGFDDDGICELFYDFTDDENPKELNKQNMIEAMNEWGLLEELGLEYNPNLVDVLAEFLMRMCKAQMDL